MFCPVRTDFGSKSHGWRIARASLQSPVVASLRGRLAPGVSLWRMSGKKVETEKTDGLGPTSAAFRMAGIRLPERVSQRTPSCMFLRGPPQFGHDRNTRIADGTGSTGNSPCGTHPPPVNRSVGTSRIVIIAKCYRLSLSTQLASGRFVLNRRTKNISLATPGFV